MVGTLSASTWRQSASVETTLEPMQAVMFLYKKLLITTFKSVQNLGKLYQEIPKILKIQAKIGKIILGK